MSQPIAYSYVRFSTPQQLQGDSLRRQTEQTAEWCQRNNVALDTSTTFKDLGKSAYTGAHRQNPDRNALAAFLKLVEQGKVPRGSYLIIENLDRLSREHIQPALLLALNLLQAGVRIVQLKPAEMVFDDKSDTLPVMMMMMELSRGNSESRIKSDRVAAAWVQKRRGASKDGKVMTNKLPAWIEQRNGALCLIPERAAVVRRIFHMAAAGCGGPTITRKLTEEGVPTFGPSGVWTRTYITTILKDRRAVGELPPSRSRRRGEQETLCGYYPAAVSEQEWLAARAGADERRRKPGRTSPHVNVFASMLFDAKSGERYWIARRGWQHRNPYRFLINESAAQGRPGCRTFSLATFEQAVLSMLKEIDPHEILNGDAGPDESLALAGELAGVEAKIAELEAELLQGDVAALARVLRRLEGEKADLSARLAEARQKAAHPLSESWGETQSILSAMDSAPDAEAARLRLRSALRRIVDSFWILVVPRGRDRLAAVQIWFAGGKRHRDYLILHRPPKANAAARTAGGWWARSLASVTKGNELDLRKRDHAKRLEKVLAEVDLSY